MAVTTVYFGTREAMIAEVGAWDPKLIGRSTRECRYLVMMDGDDGQYDTEWFSSLKDARAQATFLADTYGAKRAWIT